MRKALLFRMMRCVGASSPPSYESAVNSTSLSSSETVLKRPWALPASSRPWKVNKRNSHLAGLRLGY